MQKIEVIVWGINYRPELTGIGPFNTALCEFLVERGCAVDVVTAFAYYPEWKKRNADRGLLYRADNINGVKIHRCWTYVPGRSSSLRRIVHEASFVLLSLVRVLTMRKPSIFVVVSPPLLLGMTAWIASVLKKAPFVLHVQDLQPDAAVGLGMLQKGWLTRFLYWVEGYAYSKAERVSGISNGMLQMFRKKGVPEKKLILFPNGIRLQPVFSQLGMFRARNSISEEKFIAVYSGNLGIKQGLNILVDAANELKDYTGVRNRNKAFCESIVIVIAGDGAMRAKIAESVSSGRIKNVLLLPLQSEIEYREMLADANCSVITQQAGTGSFFFPSKLLSAVAASKPVITVADEDSELAKAVRTGGFGINVPPGRADLLADTLVMFAANCARTNAASEVGQNITPFQQQVMLKMQDKSSSIYSNMSTAGLKFAEQFEMTLVLQRFFEQVKAIVEKASST